MTKLEDGGADLVEQVRAALGATPCLTLPSPQQFYGETLVMLHKRYPFSTHRRETAKQE